MSGSISSYPVPRNLRRHLDNEFCMKFFLPQTLSIFLFFTFLFVAEYIHAQNPYPQSVLDSLRKEFDVLFNHRLFKKSKYGFIAKSLMRNQVLYENNADSLLSTASCMKLVTTSAALHRWGRNRYFPTAFLYTDSLRDSVLYGPLYIKGYGDPNFNIETLLKTVYHFYAMGLREIRGPIILDDSYLSDSPNALINDRAYAALGSALSLNFNTFTIFIRPGKKGDTAIVFIEPASPLFRIVNRTLTTDSGSGITIDHNHVSASYGKGRITVYVGGTIAEYEKEFSIYKRADNPPFYAGIIFKETMERFGIRITGDIRKGITPRHSRLLYEATSADLGTIIAGINKWSNNQAASQLCMIMGAEEYGPPGTDEKGIRVMKRFLAFIGIDTHTVWITDGSGLDAGNKMTPRAQALLLEYMYRQFSMMPEFISSLSIGGVDGTEWKRFRKNHGPVNRSRLKIGYLWSISGLSGYIETRNGDVIAFCSLINNFPKDEYETIKQLEDRLCLLIARL